MVSKSDLGKVKAAIMIVMRYNDISLKNAELLSESEPEVSKMIKEQYDNVNEVLEAAIKSVDKVIAKADKHEKRQNDKINRILKEASGKIEKQTNKINSILEETAFKIESL